MKENQDIDKLVYSSKYSRLLIEYMKKMGGTLNMKLLTILKNIKKRYYVVYVTGNSYGSCQLEMLHRIRKIEDIDEMKEYISKTWCDNKPVIIVNYKRIR